MIAVPHLGVPAPRAVCVGVVLRAGARHRRFPRSGIVTSRRGPVKERTGRSFLAPVLSAALLLGGVGCARARETGRPVAAATIAPLSDLLARVAGPDWEVRTVVPPGISAHVFEPEPSDVRRLASARLVVPVGAGYDGWIRRMAEACASTARVHATAASLGLGVHGKAEAHDEDHDPGHGHGADDPHWWLSPILAARAVPPLAEALAAVDPAGADGYRLRAQALSRELLALDEELAATLAPVKGRSFVAAHAAWSHFALRYGLSERGAIEPVPGREPSARELRALVDGARAAGDGVLFTEPQFPAGAARAVASDAGLGLVLVDPIGGVPGRATYVGTMRFNAAAFLRGLCAPAGRPEV